MTLAWQKASYSALALFKNRRELEREAQQHKADLAAREKSAAQRMEQEVRAKEQRMAHLDASIRANTAEMDRLEPAVQIARTEFEGLRAGITKLASEQLVHTNAIRDLQFERSRLESDMVIWTKEGYCLFNSKLFSKDSMVNCDTAATLSKPSDEIAAKLQEVAAVEPEKGEKLAAIKKHFFVPDFSMKHLKMFRQAVEMGYPKDRYTLEEFESMVKLAAYFQQPAPDRSSLKQSKLPEPSVKAPSLSEKKYQKYERIKQLLRELKHYTTADILENKQLNAAFRYTLQKILLFRF